jgi:hypothetical protein
MTVEPELQLVDPGEIHRPSFCLTDALLRIPAAILKFFGFGEAPD